MEEKEIELIDKRTESLEKQDSFFSKIIKTGIIAGAVYGGINKYGSSSAKAMLKDDKAMSFLIGASALAASGIDGDISGRDVMQNASIVAGMNMLRKNKHNPDMLKNLVNPIIESGRKTSFLVADMLGAGTGNDYGISGVVHGIKKLGDNDYRGMFSAGRVNQKNGGSFLDGMADYVAARSSSRIEYEDFKNNGLGDVRKFIGKIQGEYDIPIPEAEREFGKKFRIYQKIDKTFDIAKDVFNSKIVKGREVDYKELENLEMMGNIKAIRSLFSDFKTEKNYDKKTMVKAIKDGEFDEYVKSTAPGIFESIHSSGTKGLSIEDAYKDYGYEGYLKNKYNSTFSVDKRGKYKIDTKGEPIGNVEMMAIGRYNLTNSLSINKDGSIKDLTEGSKLFMLRDVLKGAEQVSNAFYRAPLVGQVFKQWNPVAKINQTLNLAGIKSRELKNVQYSEETFSHFVKTASGDSIEVKDVNKIFLTSDNYIKIAGEAGSSSRNVEIKSMKGAKIWDSSESLRAAYGYNDNEMRVSKDNIYKSYTFVNSDGNVKNEANLFDIMFRKGVLDENLNEVSGVKGRFEAFSNSRYNRFRFRYEEGVGFRKTSFEEDYNVEGTIFDLTTNSRKRIERKAEVEAVKSSIISKIKNVSDAVGIKTDGSEDWEYNDIIKRLDEIGKNQNVQKLSTLGSSDMKNDIEYLGYLHNELKDFNANRTDEMNEFLKKLSRSFGAEETETLFGAIDGSNNRELLRGFEEKAASLAMSNAWENFSYNHKDINMVDFLLNKEGIKVNLNLSDTEHRSVAENITYGAKRVINTKFNLGQFQQSMEEDKGIIHAIKESLQVEQDAFKELKRQNEIEFISESMRKNEVIRMKNGDVKTSTLTNQEKEYKSAMSLDSRHSNFIIGQSTISAFLETKGVLDKVKVLVEHFKGTSKDVTSIDMLSGHVSVAFEQSLEGLGAKKSYSGFMGIDKSSPYKTFAKVRNGHSGIYDITKYAILPAVGVGLAYSWIDKGTDAVIDDDVPIIGGGITGAAAQAYGAARVGMQYGLKYSGMLWAMNNMDRVVPGLFNNAITDIFDLTMDPEEMKDVYFNGKEIRVNKNRWWWTAGRGSGSGEDFGYYRKSLIYAAQHRDQGVYDDKIQKFFRKDFQPTGLLWTFLDPYMDEVKAYENLGVKYAKSEQLFEDMPVIGGLLNVTVGQIIKPTKYFWEHEWRVGENLAINPNYNPNDPMSKKFIEFDEENSFLNLKKAAFDAFEDLKTISGIKGYMLSVATKTLFGKSNPYKDTNELRSLDDDYGIAKSYYDLELGDMLGITEPIRRLIDDHESTGQNNIDVTVSRTPSWMTNDMAIGNIYARTPFAHLSLSKRGEEVGDLEKLRQLALFDPYSSEYKNLERRMMKNDYEGEEYADLLQSISYSQGRGRNTLERYGENNFGTEFSEVNFGKAEYQENGFFTSNGKRYKLTGIETDFNQLSKAIGKEDAIEKMEEVRRYINSGNFRAKIEVGSNSVQSDRNGEYQEVFIDSLQDSSNYKMSRIGSGFIASAMFEATKRYHDAIKPAHLEKLFGEKSAYAEWVQEGVAASEFRDWENPYSSFISPIRSLSSTGITGYLSMGSLARNLDDASGTYLFGAMNKVGGLNMLVGNTMWGSQYAQETEIMDNLEEINANIGERSIYTSDENSSLFELKRGLNSADSKFFEKLVNVRDENQRTEILNTANERMQIALSTVWNKQASHSNSEPIYEIPDFEIEENFQAPEGYTANNNLESLLYKAEYNIGYNRIDEIKKAALAQGTDRLRGSDILFIRDKIKRRYGPNAKVRVNSNLRDRGEIILN